MSTKNTLLSEPTTNDGYTLINGVDLRCQESRCDNEIEEWDDDDLTSIFKKILFCQWTGQPKNIL